MHGKLSPAGSEEELVSSSFAGDFARLSGLAIAPVLLFALILFGINGWQQREAVLDGLARRASGAAAALDRMFETQITVLETLSGSASLDDHDLPKFFMEARRALKAQPYWTTIILSDTSGQQILNLLRPLGTELPVFPDLESHRRAVETARPVIVGRPWALGPITGAPVFGIRVPVIRDGQIIYILTASLKPEAVLEPLHDLNLPVGWVGAFIDQQSRIVSCLSCPGGSIGREVSEAATLNLATGRTDADVLTTSSGVRSFVAIDRAPLTGWAAAVRVPVSDVNALWSKSLWLLGLAGLVSVLAALLSLAAFIRHRQVSRRMLQTQVKVRTSELQGALSQRDLLLREVHHRVYNNLQIVEAIIALGKTDLSFREEMFDDLRQRVHVLAIVHRQLMSSSDLSSLDVEPLLSEVVQTARAAWRKQCPSSEVLTQLTPLRVDVDFAQPLALLTNEILKVLMRKGAPSYTINLAMRDVRQEESVLQFRASAAAEMNLGVRPAKLIDSLLAQLQADLNVLPDQITVRIQRPTSSTANRQRLAFISSRL